MSVAWLRHLGHRFTDLDDQQIDGMKFSAGLQGSIIICNVI